MKIVRRNGCPTGIAHTYMAAEQLEKAARKLGHGIRWRPRAPWASRTSSRPEIRGDAAILRQTSRCRSASRFYGKRIVETSVQEAIKHPRRPASAWPP